jgi:hypothetical protein
MSPELSRLHDMSFSEKLRLVEDLWGDLAATTGGVFLLAGLVARETILRGITDRPAAESEIAGQS